MKRSKYTEEQIAFALKRAEVVTPADGINNATGWCGKARRLALHDTSLYQSRRLSVWQYVPTRQLIALRMSQWPHKVCRLRDRKACNWEPDCQMCPLH